MEEVKGASIIELYKIEETNQLAKNSIYRPRYLSPRYVTEGDKFSMLIKPIRIQKKSFKIWKKALIQEKIYTSKGRTQYKR